MTWRLTKVFDGFFDVLYCVNMYCSVVWKCHAHPMKIVCIASGYYHLSKFLFNLANKIFYQISIHMRDLAVVNVPGNCTLPAVGGFVGDT